MIGCMGDAMAASLTILLYSRISIKLRRFWMCMVNPLLLLIGLRLVAGNDIVFVHSPDILSLACHPLRGLEGITPDHCATTAVTEDRVRSGQRGCSGEEGWPPERSVHTLGSVRFEGSTPCFRGNGDQDKSSRKSDQRRCLAQHMYARALACIRPRVSAALGLRDARMRHARVSTLSTLASRAE